MNPSSTNQFVPWKVAIDRLKFKKRVCTTFIPKETDKQSCVCNYDHPNSAEDHTNETWNWKKHTKQEDSDCYGIMPQSKSPYLRCDIETDPEQLCSLLLGIWSIPTPGLIMRMIGDLDYTPSTKIEKELLQGIADAAIASDAWIITNGYKEESIAELVGEVVYTCRIKKPDLNFSAIAVGKWGNIRDCHKLEDRLNENSTTQTATYKRRGQYKLEPNHTHYIFFDDGTCDSVDTGEFASKLAQQLSCESRRRMPLVNVLVGGTLHALPSLYTDLKKSIPVVIVNGCGPFGDILTKYLKLTEEFYKASKDVNQRVMDENDSFSESENENLGVPVIDEIVLPDSSQKTLRNVLQSLGTNRSSFVKDVQQLYKIMREQQYAAQGKRLSTGEPLNLEEEKDFGRCLHQIASCFTESFRENIHVFEINSSKTLKETIYNAFVQARDTLSQTKKMYNKTVEEEVHLALRWSIGNVTDNQSEAAAKIWNDRTKTKQNRSFLIDAMSKNLLVFVSNFVKLDVDFNILFGPIAPSLTKKDTRWSRKRYYLQELYSDAVRPNSHPLYLLDQISSRVDFTEEKHLAYILKKLISDFIHPLYGDQLETSDASSMMDSEQCLDYEKTSVEYIYRDLFIWCVLTYRLDMAKVFLSEMDTRICSALIASKILKGFIAYAPDQAARDTLKKNAEGFENHAIEFVRCAYANDKHLACELIMRRVDCYGGVTSLQMAFAADNKRFLYEDTCQALLTNIWYDKVDPVREQNQLILNLLTLGISQFFISIFEKHYHRNYSRLKKKHQTITSAYPKRQLKDNGIDYTDDYDQNSTILQHFFHFHNRPIVKYCYSFAGYILFLLFFSYYMLFHFNPLSKSTPNMHWTEILTIITVTTMRFEELRQIGSEENRSIKGKLCAYFDLKNRISNLSLVLPAYLLFYIGLILRFTQRDIERFTYARVIMAIDLELWFIKSILFIGIAPQIGPKIVMIRKMTNDLLLFIVIIVIFICGYGITSRSMTAYGTTDITGRNFFRNVIYPVYYFVHGSFDSERAQLESTPENHMIIVTQIIFALHMLFVNILLINLLIALFGFTVNDIQTQAHYVWAYDRCDIIRTYHNRPPLFPPLTFVISIILWCQRCCRYLCFKKQFRDELMPCFKMIPINSDVDRIWSEFERYSTNAYIRLLLDDQVVTNSNVLTSHDIFTSSSMNQNEMKRLQILIGDLQYEMNSSLSNNEEKLELMKTNITELQTRFSQIETNFNRWSGEMRQIKDSLNWMMKTMANGNLIDESPPFIQDQTLENTSSRQNRSSVTSSIQTKLSPRPSNND